MPRICASFVYTCSGPPLRNAVVELDGEGMVLSVGEDTPAFTERAGVEYYSGILVPGFADVMCGDRISGHRLLAGGVRVAGRIGYPPDKDGSYEEFPETGPVLPAEHYESRIKNFNASLKAYCAANSTKAYLAARGSKADRAANFTKSDCSAPRLSWKHRYGASIDYRVFSDTGHFEACFIKGDIGGLWLQGGGGDGTSVLAGFGERGLTEIMYELQQGRKGLTLWQIFDIAAFNGAYALGCDDTAGKILPGMRPGLNLIEGADLKNMRLLPQSHLRRLC